MVFESEIGTEYIVAEKACESRSALGNGKLFQEILC
jgi:hypothetical protein